MPASSLLTDLLQQPAYGIRFDYRSCLRARLNTCNCRDCLKACPAGALTLADRAIRLDSERCSGCHRCVSVCPNDALQSGFPIRETLHEARRRSAVVFSCSNQPQQSIDEVEVPCLGIFTRAELLYLGVSGIKSVYFNTAGCDNCDNHSASQAFQADLAELKKSSSLFLQADMGLTWNEERNMAEAGDRRKFLNRLKKNLVDSTRTKFSSPRREPDKGTSRRATHQTKLINEAVSFAPAAIRQQLAEHCTPQLRVQPNCTCCPLCSGICPTGALKLTRGTDGKKLLFNAKICSSCRLCEAFCKQEALTLTSPPLLIDSLQKPGQTSQEPDRRSRPFP